MQFCFQPMLSSSFCNARTSPGQEVTGPVHGTTWALFQQNVRSRGVRSDLLLCFPVQHPQAFSWEQPHSAGSCLTLLTWARGVLAPLTGTLPRPLSSKSRPGERSLRVLSSRPGDFSLSRGLPGDLSLRSSVRPSRYRWGVLGSRGWPGPSGGPGLEATRLVMCSLYVGGPLLFGLLSFKNNWCERWVTKTSRYVFF